MFYTSQTLIPKIQKDVESAKSRGKSMTFIPSAQVAESEMAVVNAYFIKKTDIKLELYRCPLGLWDITATW